MKASEKLNKELEKSVDPGFTAKHENLKTRHLFTFLTELWKALIRTIT